jgi:hypothetical protein
VLVNIFSGEWDYVPNVALRYIDNDTDAEYNQRTSGVNIDGYPISKLPKEVSQAMWNALDSYDLDVGDVFLFSCGYEWTSPKAIFVVLRITRINNDGTYTYNFRAWQVQ